MIPPRFYGPIGAISLLAVGCAFLVVFDPDGKGRLAEYLGLGYLFGTLFGQATLAAAWTALGSHRLYWRLALTIGWLFLMWCCVAANMVLHGGPNEILLVLGACLV